jgi:hypothetical protein
MPSWSCFRVSAIVGRRGWSWAILNSLSNDHPVRDEGFSAVARAQADGIRQPREIELAQLKQLASLTGNFYGAPAQKRESNQRRLIANRL